MSTTERGRDGAPPVPAATPLIGRDDELEVVRAALDDPRVRLVTITGRGGVGKTRLASEVVRRRAGKGDPVTFVSLAGVGDQSLVMSEIGTALGLPSGGAEDADEVVAARLGSDDHLLVLDNLEHLPDAGPQLATLLERCRGLRILATSQAPLRLRPEQVVRLEPLPVPTRPAVGAPVELDVTEPTIALYLAAAAAADAGFEPAGHERAAVVELCRRLEGLPLALELAGARAATLRPNELLRCLDEVGLATLSRPRGDVPPRHHDLVAAITWTVDLLPPPDQELLALLSGVPGSFSVDTVLAMGDPSPVDILDRLAALVDLHLVEVGAFDPRPGSRAGLARTDCYVVPSSVREVALGRAASIGALDEVRRRAVAGWGRQAAAAADLIEANAAGVPLAVGGDGDGVAAALQIALDETMADEALDLVRVLAERWDHRVYHRVHEELLERCLALADERGADPVRRARVLVWSVRLGIRHSSTRSREELFARLAEAEAVGERVGDDGTVLAALETRILTTPITGDLDGAGRAAVRSLELASRPANRRYLDAARVWAGMVAFQQGDPDRALELGRAALASARATGDRGALVRTSLLLGPVARLHADLLAEVPSNEEALELARQAGQPFYEAIILVRLGFEAVRAGDRRRALLRNEESLLMARAMVGSPFVGFQLLESVSALALDEEWEPAARLYGVVRPVLPFVAGYDLDVAREVRAALVDRVRAALGDDGFEAEADQGTGLAWAEAIELALDATREALAHADTGLAVVPEPGSPTPVDGRLTPRQDEVLRLLATGMSNKDIARELGLTAKSVMHHTTAIYRTLGVRGRSEATAWAFRSGYLEDPSGSTRETG